MPKRRQANRPEPVHAHSCRPPITDSYLTLVRTDLKGQKRNVSNTILLAFLHTTRLAQ